MPVNPKCRTCTYWRQLRSNGHGGENTITGAYACHYILDKGTRRKRDGDVCLSYAKRTRGRKHTS